MAMWATYVPDRRSVPTDFPRPCARSFQPNVAFPTLLSLWGRAKESARTAMVTRVLPASTVALGLGCLQAIRMVGTWPSAQSCCQVTVRYEPPATHDASVVSSDGLRKAIRVPTRDHILTEHHDSTMPCVDVIHRPVPERRRQLSMRMRK